MSPPTRPTADHLSHLRGGPRPLAEWPLLVLVGVTGVGKSTALAALGAYRVLPDRRLLTDAVMLNGEAVTDREERFRRTAAYRERHPGGMAAALAELRPDPAHWPTPLAFDGLRGEDEVRQARRYPGWRFLSLHAPDAVRVRRLLGRADEFDAVAGGGVGELRAELKALAAGLFTPAELDQLAALPHPPAEVLAKTRIVVAERRNYDPQAARAALAGLAAVRHLELDTAQLSAQQVQARIAEWL